VAISRNLLFVWCLSFFHGRPSDFSVAQLVPLNMIIGPSQRRLHRGFLGSLQPAFEQLQLPWLAPALHHRARRVYDSPSRRSRTTAAAAAAARRPSPPGNVSLSTPAVGIIPGSPRGRAYAYSAPTERGGHDDIPWANDGTAHEEISANSWSQLPDASARSSLSDLPMWDPNDPLVINDSTTSPVRKFRMERTGLSHADITDMHMNLEACLAVGLYQRAATSMRRLRKIYKPDAPDLLRAHNFYIGHLLGQYLNSNDQFLDEYVRTWYQVDIIKEGIRPDATTLSLMTQFALRDSNYGRAARRVRRLALTAQKYGFLGAYQIEMGNALPLSEYKRLDEIAPGFFDATDYDPQSANELGEFEEPVAMHSPSESDVIARESRLLPEIKATPQKGSGLRALHKSMSALSEDATQSPSASEDGNIAMYSQTNLDRQMRLEEDSRQSAIDRWRKDAEDAAKREGMHSSLRSKSMGALIWEWHQVFMPLVHEELAKLDDIDDVPEQFHKNLPEEEQKQILENADRAHYGPYLRFLSAEQLSITTVVAVLNMIAQTGIANITPIANLITIIGNAVEKEVGKVWAQKRRMNVYTKSDEQIADLTRKGSARNFERAPIPRTAGAKQQMADHGLGILSAREVRPPVWGSFIKVKIGALLASFLFQAAKLDVPTLENPEVTQSANAFEMKVKFLQGKRLGIVYVHDMLRIKLSAEPSVAGAVRLLPMLTEPMPWTSFDKGAYLKESIPIVRHGAPMKQAKSYYRLAIANGDMKQIMAGLDALGKVPWLINRNVFEVMINVWNTGEQFANIPPRDPQIPIPEKPAVFASNQEKIEFYLGRKRASDELAGHHSNRCFINFQLEVARAYADRKFYMPHNMDFRGRAYPIPPYLNHMGADHCRGLLLFADGKELGERGLQWLKVHMANVYGFDKASLTDRRSFAEEHVQDIFDAADKPLDGKRWWLKGEDPWQCLATCMELAKALRSPDPTKYVSHLPVHQDGTCNGLQHYAALGGDALGAKQVNLEPGEKPSDIYTTIATIVKEAVAKDAAAGVEVAKLLDGKIVRKVVKQTVMTNVYGVTFTGARTQVMKQLEDLYPDTFGTSTGYDGGSLLFLSGTYIAKEIFNALGQIFNGAINIQKWLGECGARICDALTPEQLEMLKDHDAGKAQPAQYNKVICDNAEDVFGAFRSSIIWTTPLRMPVIQPYRNASRRRIETIFVNLSLHDPSLNDQVAKRKQLQAFPPNFIHSLDATHMLLSALRCRELDITFAAVHDSFWTHPADVDTMSTVLRDAFVRMHSEDIITRMSTEFSARYKDCMYLAKIDATGDLGKKVNACRSRLRADARRASGPGSVDKSYRMKELLLEVKRHELLASEDPKLVEEGQQMMTPGRIVTEHEDMEKGLVWTGRIEGGLGVTPSDTPEEIPTDIAPAKAVHGDVNSIDLLDSESNFAEDWTAPSDEGIENDTKEPEQRQDGVVEDINRSKTTPSRMNKAEKAPQRQVWVWLPLQFPPVPKKVRLISNPYL